MQFNSARILVFAKAPVAGQAKTRLIPALGAQGAADLHGRLLRHTLTTASTAQLCPVELWCSGNADHPFIQQCLHDYPITLKQQQGADLGARMHNAISQTLDDGVSAALLIGTDCPTLTHGDLAAALHALTEGKTCVLAPAEDGGYVLIGLQRSEAQLFEDIAWGTETVFAATQKRLEQLGIQWQQLRSHRDVDVPEDLTALAQIPGFC